MARANLKVLHVLDHSVPLFSGYAFRSLNIARAQKTAGITPVVLTSAKHGACSSELEEFENIRHYRTREIKDGCLGGMPFVRELLLMTRLRRRILQVARSERVDLIHSHSPSLNGLPALSVARQLRVPLVYEARAFWEDAAVDHGTFREKSLRYRVSRGVENIVFRGADRIAVISHGMRTELATRGIPAERVRVFPNGVDIGSFQPLEPNPELRVRLGLNGHPVFGFIGSFYHYEGLRLLLEAFPEILSELPGARLVLVGGGAEELVLKQIGSRCAEAVTFIGPVPHAEIQNYYSMIDVFVYPRHRMRLTDLVTPLKPLEAMAMGKIVLASDVGGHKELIEHGATGLLFRADDRKALVAGAIQAASDAGLRGKIGRAARQHVAAHRTWERTVDQYLELYRELLAPAR